MADVEVNTHDSKGHSRPALPRPLLHTREALDLAYVPVLTKPPDVVLVPDDDGAAKTLRDFLGDVFTFVRSMDWSVYLYRGQTPNARSVAAKYLKTLPWKKTENSTASSSSNIESSQTSSKHQETPSVSYLSERNHSTQISSSYIRPVEHAVTCTADSSSIGGNVPLNDLPSASNVDTTDEAPASQNSTPSDSDASKDVPREPKDTRIQQSFQPENATASRCVISRKKKVDENIPVCRQPKSKAPRLSYPTDSSQQTNVPKKEVTKTLSWEENFKMSILGYPGTAKPMAPQLPQSSTTKNSTTSPFSKISEAVKSSSTSADMASTSVAVKENTLSPISQSKESSTNSNVTITGDANTTVKTQSLDENKPVLEGMKLHPIALTLSKDELFTRDVPNKTLLSTDITNKESILTTDTTETKGALPPKRESLLTDVSNKELTSSKGVHREDSWPIVPTRKKRQSLIKAENFISKVTENMTKNKPRSKSMIQGKSLNADVRKLMVPKDGKSVKETSVRDASTKIIIGNDKKKIDQMESVERKRNNTQTLADTPTNEQMICLSETARRNGDTETDNDPIAGMSPQIDVEDIDIDQDDPKPISNGTPYSNFQVAIDDIANYGIQEVVAHEESVGNTYQTTPTIGQPKKSKVGCSKLEVNQSNKSPLYDNDVTQVHEYQMSGLDSKRRQSGIRLETNVLQDTNINKISVTEHSDESLIVDVESEESPKGFRQKQEPKKRKGQLDTTVPGKSKRKRSSKKGRNSARASTMTGPNLIMRKDSKKSDSSYSKKKGAKTDLVIGSQKTCITESSLHPNVEVERDVSVSIGAPDMQTQVESHVSDSLKQRTRKRKNRSADQECIEKTPIDRPIKEKIKSALDLQELAVTTKTNKRKRRRKRGGGRKSSTSSQDVASDKPVNASVEKECESPMARNPPNKRIVLKISRQNSAPGDPSTDSRQQQYVSSYIHPSTAN